MILYCEGGPGGGKLETKLSKDAYCTNYYYCKELPFRTLPLELPTASIRVAASFTKRLVCFKGGGSS